GWRASPGRQTANQPHFAPGALVLRAGACHVPIARSGACASAWGERNMCARAGRGGLLIPRIAGKQNMCELDDLDEFSRRMPDFTRRQFGSLAVGASLALLFPLAALAEDLTDADVDIKTPDGVADCYFVRPKKGKHPAVLICPDIFGLRPAFKEMARRLAGSGYSVLVFNPFYRTKKAPTAPEHANFDDPATRNALMALAGSTNADTMEKDA